jgi:hypothetical protein
MDTQFYFCHDRLVFLYRRGLITAPRCGMPDFQMNVKAGMLKVTMIEK